MSSIAAASGKKMRTLAETTTTAAGVGVIASTSASAGLVVEEEEASSRRRRRSTPTSTALRDSIAGALAGSANLLCGYPFDIVKTTLQAAPPGTYSSPWAAARAIARGETAATSRDASATTAAATTTTAKSKNSTGFRAFFRGASAPLVGAALETGVNYACYSASLRGLSKVLSLPNNGGETTSASTSNDDDLRLTAPLPVVAAAAAVAGGALSFVLSPFELVKVRLQADAAFYEGPTKSTAAAVAATGGATTATAAISTTTKTTAAAGPASVLRATLAAEGPLGLTRGLVGTMAREVPGNAIFFATYESLRRWFYFFDATPRARGAAGDVLFPSDASSAISADSTPSPSLLRAAASSVAAGGVAGGIMWGVVLPLDSAKTRIQLERPGAARAEMLATLRSLYREGGRRSLWAGLAPTLARAVPANAAQWLAFEAALSVWPKAKE